MSKYPLKKLLFNATKSENILEISRILKQNKEYLHVTDGKGRNFLHIAVENHSTGLIEYILKNYDYNIHATDKDGRTIADLAAYMGFTDLLERLITITHYSKPLSDNVRTLLHFAAMGNQLEVIEFLIEQSIVFDQKDMTYKTALQYSIAFCPDENFEIFYKLKEYCMDYSGILHTAIEKNNKKLVENILDKKKFNIDINSFDNNGKTALHIAIQNKNVDLVTLLLTNGASAVICAKAKNAEPALQLAARMGNLKITKLIIEKNGGINLTDIRDNKNNTLIHKAILAKNSLEMLEYYSSLVTNTIFLDATNKDGYTPLQLAAENGDIETIKFLVDNGCNYNAVNQIYSVLDYAITYAYSKGANPENAQKIFNYLIDKRDIVIISSLKRLIESNNINFVSPLLKIGADKNFQKKSLELLKLACNQGNLDMITLLVNNGIDINTENIEELLRHTGLYQTVEKGGYVSARNIDAEVSSIFFLATSVDDIYNLEIPDQNILDKIEWKYDINDKYTNIISNRITNKLIRIGIPKTYQKLEEYHKALKNLVEILSTSIPKMESALSMLDVTLTSHHYQQAQVKNTLDKYLRDTYKIKFDNDITSSTIFRKNTDDETIKTNIKTLLNTITDSSTHQLTETLVELYPSLNGLQQSTVLLGNSYSEITDTEESSNMG